MVDFLIVWGTGWFIILLACLIVGWLFLDRECLQPACLPVCLPACLLACLFACWALLALLAPCSLLYPLGLALFAFLLAYVAICLGFVRCLVVSTCLDFSDEYGSTWVCQNEKYIWLRGCER